MSLIARVWFDEIDTERSEEYVDYVRRTGVRDLTRTEGNRGVQVWTRPAGKTTEIGVISFWRSLRDVERFAGANVATAVYYDQDRDYLLRMAPELIHYEVPIVEGLRLENSAPVPEPSTRGSQG